MPGLTDMYVDKSEVKTSINGQKKAYICETCVRYLRLKKMPPMCVMNNLKLVDTDKDLLEQNLELTELEGALIAKNIIFQKIFQLPKSRWTALKDRVINVPINNESIMNTLEKMPRTPSNAGLVGVALKRKQEYKNTHKHQLINPEKLYRILRKLKNSGNPHYQFYDDYNAYQVRCKTTDPTGNEAIFNEDNLNSEKEKEGDVDKTLNDSDSETDSEAENDKKDEIILNTMDPVKKYQFKYNESLCMIDKYPEISRNPDASVSVAPGEGQIPKNIMDDEDWDVKAFPHLHNADGSNGKDHDRRVRLTDQNYFIQRICNKEQRFAKSPAYMYAALAFIEKKQINRNISLAGTRGKQVKSKDGRTSYELKDAYRVLENVRNTPRYWKQAKYEMLAKLDNLGAFQIFFTLSCADMRWDENFAAILLDRGFDIKYKLVND